MALYFWNSCCLARSSRARAVTRSKGVPQLGAGAIYQVPEADIVVRDFAIPDHWPRGYGLDVGWKKTTAVWGALDRETGVIYLYSEHYAGMQQPSLHAEAIKSRGKWIPGVIDPASQGRTQTDGLQLIQLYRDCGLDLEPAISAVESGLYQAWQLMSAGKLKVFASLGNWLSEFRMYQRDSVGRIVKQNDHLMDATRYLIVSGRERMKVKTGSTGRTTSAPHLPWPATAAMDAVTAKVANSGFERCKRVIKKTLLILMIGAVRLGVAPGSVVMEKTQGRGYALCAQRKS
jgi:hypothetical protein